MECCLRLWRKEDAPDLAAALNNPKILNCLRDGLPYPYLEKDALEFIDEMAQHQGRQEAFPFAITVNDRAIGSIGVFRKDNIHYRTAELGYYIAEPYWGQGIGTSAVKQMCEFIFSETDIVRIFAMPFSHNPASCRVLEKAGFVLEGELRKNAVKNGEFYNMKMYSLLKD